MIGCLQIFSHKSVWAFFFVQAERDLAEVN